jgi:rhodanese-related sulfurtransferase
VLDVRARAHYDQAADQIPGSVRVPPDQVAAWANTVPPGVVVAYCT